MGRPCGCSGPCGCDIRGRNGITTDGSGTPGDPLWIELDPSNPVACQGIMDCVGGSLGSGLIYNPATRRVSVRVSGGTNQLTIGPDGGLLVAGAGGGGSDGGQTVANLPTATNSIIGSTWGAGSMLWAEGTRATYEAARNMAGTTLRMVHVPVRRSSDLYPICLAEDDLGWYWSSTYGTPRELDHREHANMRYEPAGDPPVEDGGYMGFSQPVSIGTPNLGEVLDLLARRVVLVIETREVSAPIDIAARVKELAPQWNASPSIIAAGELKAAVSGTGATILHQVATTMAGTGIAVGAFVRQRQQILDYTPAALVALGVSWVFMDYQFADAANTTDYVAGAVAAYKAAGLNVMFSNVHRQWHYELALAAGVRGSLCTDPIYAYGKLSNYRYRGDNLSTVWGAPNVGQTSPWSHVVPIGMSAHRRGFVRAGEPHIYTIPANVVPPDESEPYMSGYHILAGRAMPLRNADTYAVQAWFTWRGSLSTDRGRWVSLFVDRPTDRSLTTWTRATARTIGYDVQLSQNGDFVLYEYDGTPGAPPESRITVVPAGYAMGPNIWYGIRVEMTPTVMRVYASSAPWPGPFTKALRITKNNPHRYISGTNNGYVFYGRHFFNVPDSREVQVAGLEVHYGGFSAS